ncbi:MAG: hypothetical protein U0821_26805 [Chloroflexota bacterium]
MSGWPIQNPVDALKERHLKGARQITREALAALWCGRRLFLTVWLVLALPLDILGAVNPRPYPGTALVAPDELISISALALLDGLIRLAAHVIIAAVVVVWTGSLHAEQLLTGSALIRLSIERVWAVITGWLLGGLCVVGLVLSLIGTPVAVYLSMAWLFCTPASVLEHRSGIAGMVRSLQLVRGRYWRCKKVAAGVLGPQLLAMLLVSGLSLALGSPQTWIDSTGFAIFPLWLMCSVGLSLAMGILVTLTWVATTIQFLDLVQHEKLPVMQVNPAMAA